MACELMFDARKVSFSSEIWESMFVYFITSIACFAGFNLWAGIFFRASHGRRALHFFAIIRAVPGRI